jgi:hypothetical protein
VTRQFSDDGMEWPFSWSPPGRGRVSGLVDGPFAEVGAAMRQFTEALVRLSEHAEQAQQQQHHEQYHDDPDDVAHGHRGPP